MSVSEQIGGYRLGFFYSDSVSGVPYEHDLVRTVGKGDVGATLRIVTLLHETMHYVHDLSLGVCFNREVYADRAAVRLFPALAARTRGGPVRLPLCPAAGARAGVPTGGPLAEASACERMADQLLYATTAVDTSPGAGEASGLGDRTDLSVVHLLEGVAAVRTLTALAGRARDDEDRAWLRSMAEELPILPDDLPPLYHLAPRLCDATVGRLFTRGVNPRDLRAWPDHVYQTGHPRTFLDLAFCFLAEAALHIPPLPDDLPGAGAPELPRALDPVARFLDALRIVQEESGFPDSDSAGPSGYFRVLYDWLAERAGWPHFMETHHRWGHTFSSSWKVRHAMTDLYRLRGLTHRRTRMLEYMTHSPWDTCADIHVPVVHLTPNGVKTFRILNVHGGGQLVAEFELPSLAPDDLVGLKVPAWTDQPADAERAREWEAERTTTFFQELVMRTTCWTLVSALLHEPAYACPWAGHGCAVARPECRAIRRLADVPREGCALRRYLALHALPPERLSWEGA